jgi:hypothetical protein
LRSDWLASSRKLFRPRLVALKKIRRFDTRARAF